MALTYTEIEEEKNARILIFFGVVLLFYFIIALVLGNITKIFFFTQSNLPGKKHLFLTAKEFFYVFLFAFSAALLHSLYSVKNAARFIKKNLDTQNIDLSDRYHRLFNTVVSEVDVATGSKYKVTPVVIPTVAMNAFAISDRGKNAILGVTEGLLSKLNRQQLEAVVAHEFGHIVSGDSFQTTVGCSLFAIYAAMLRGLRKIFAGSRRERVSVRVSGNIVLFLFLIYIVLSIMQFFYTLIRLFVSRDRELRADAIAVRLTRDPISLSEALYAISRGWRGIGYIDENFESLFIINPAREDMDEKEGFWANLMSTHPPIIKRLSILANMAHTDVENVKEKVLREEKLKEKMRETTLFDEGIEGLKTASFNCPKCDEALREEDYEGIVLYRCFSCGGVLVEKDKITRIMIRREKGFDERTKKMAALAQKDGLERIRSAVKEKVIMSFKCPACGTKMMKGFYTQAYLIEVDQCIHCNRAWFDKDELEMLQYLIENKKVA